MKTSPATVRHFTLFIAVCLCAAFLAGTVGCAQLENPPVAGVYWKEGNAPEVVSSSQARRFFLKTDDGKHDAFQTLSTDRFTAYVDEDDLDALEAVLRQESVFLLFREGYPRHSDPFSVDPRYFKATDHWKMAAPGVYNDCEDFVLRAMHRAVTEGGVDPGAIGIAEVLVTDPRLRAAIHGARAPLGMGTLDSSAGQVPRGNPGFAAPFGHALLVVNVKQRDGSIGPMYADPDNAWFFLEADDKPYYKIQRQPVSVDLSMRSQVIRDVMYSNAAGVRSPSEQMLPAMWRSYDTLPCIYCN